MSDYYDILGIPRSANQKEVRQAYRSLARQYHPDVNAGEKTSEERFKQINEAYSVLSDAENRRKYDRYGDNWAHSDQIEDAQARAGREGTFRRSSTGGADPYSIFDTEESSVFDRLFRNIGNIGQEARRPTATEYTAEITLEEAYKGTNRVMALPGGRRLEVKIPPGVDNGSRIHVSPDSGSGGDFYLVVSVKPHARFQRQGRDLYVEVEASFEDAILGGDLNVSSLGGRLALNMPPETQNGRRFRLAGQGMPGLNDPETRGDLYATVKVKLPTNLSTEEQELFRRFKELRDEKRR